MVGTVVVGAVVVGAVVIGAVVVGVVVDEGDELQAVKATMVATNARDNTKTVLDFLRILFNCISPFSFFSLDYKFPVSIGLFELGYRDAAQFAFIEGGRRSHRLVLQQDVGHYLFVLLFG